VVQCLIDRSFSVEFLIHPTFHRFPHPEPGADVIISDPFLDRFYVYHGRKSLNKFIKLSIGELPLLAAYCEIIGSQRIETDKIIIEIERIKK